MPLKNGWRTLPFRRLRPEFDLGQQRRLNPYPSVRDLLAVRLGFADQRLEPRVQVLCGCGVKAMVDLSGIDQVPALAAPAFTDTPAMSRRGARSMSAVAPSRSAARLSRRSLTPRKPA